MTMTMNEAKIPTDRERLQSVIEKLGLTANSLSVKLEFKSAASIYHVLNGVNNLSAGLIDRIITKYPKVSYSYLKTGEGEVLLDDKEMQNQMNFFNFQPQSNPLLEFAEIPSKLDQLINLQIETNELLREILNK